MRSLFLLIVLPLINVHECENDGLHDWMDGCHCTDNFYGSRCQFSCHNGSPRFKHKGWLLFWTKYYVGCKCHKGWEGPSCDKPVASSTVAGMSQKLATIPPPHLIWKEDPERPIQPRLWAILGVVGFALVLLFIGMACGGFCVLRLRNKRKNRVAQPKPTQVNISLVGEPSLSLPPPYCKEACEPESQF